jgi:hypothetical protein
LGLSGAGVLVVVVGVVVVVVVVAAVVVVGTEVVVVVGGSVLTDGPVVGEVLLARPTAIATTLAPAFAVADPRSGAFPKLKRVPFFSTSQ